MAAIRETVRGVLKLKVRSKGRDLSNNNFEKKIEHVVFANVKQSNQTLQT
jgi:hypothetical protein